MSAVSQVNPSFQRSAKPASGPQVINLGTIPANPVEGPGSKLSGKTFQLRPGDSIKIVVPTNQIRNMGQIDVAPLVLDVKDIKPMNPGQLGNVFWREYTFTVPKDLKPGTYGVTTSGSPQTHNNPLWAFSFDVKVPSVKPPKPPKIPDLKNAVVTEVKHHGRGYSRSVFAEVQGKPVTLYLQGPDSSVSGEPRRAQLFFAPGKNTSFPGSPEGGNFVKLKASQVHDFVEGLQRFIENAPSQTAKQKKLMRDVRDLRDDMRGLGLQ
jgi:hypothetical protein